MVYVLLARDKRGAFHWIELYSTMELAERRLRKLEADPETKQYGTKYAIIPGLEIYTK
ncbi:MAG TPA: hypothetical protein VJ279_01925 [Hanamia sp.]|jgi:hypothetical protein|nr:hypothetical protein [Hanamia sp.]